MKDINEKIALSITKCFGSMITFWIFCIWAFLPLIPALSNYKESILYISSGFIQLAALPLIMVGQDLLGRESKERALIDHERIQTQFYRMEEAMTKLNEIVIEVRELHKHTHKLIKDEIDKDDQ